jgi:hypothetical protein
MLGHVLIGASILLKQAVVSGVIVLWMTVPTYFFSKWTKEQFLRSYNDTALLQTSQLDGWDHCKTLADRERYRRWLVDCHKASYVPICLAGGADFLTSQPAVAVPTMRDLDVEEDDESTVAANSPSPRRGLKRWKQESSRLIQNTSQKGALFRRYLES